MFITQKEFWHILLLLAKTVRRIILTSLQQKEAFKISLKGMLINLALFVIKGVAGLLINSVSLMSDAVHSLTDIFSTLVVLVGIKISSRPADKKHPYGHERIECIVAFLLGIMLFVIGFSIGFEGFQKIFADNQTVNKFYTLNIIAILSAVVSIGAKEWMYHFTINYAKAIHSPSMEADAWHHRSDAMSSVGSLVGVIGLCFGYPIIDIIACFIISLFIFKAAYSICSDACKRIIDSSASENTIMCIKNSIMKNNDVISIDILNTRQFGSRIYVDIEITLDKNMTFEKSHQIAHNIHDTLEKEFPEIKHCMIHVNPSQ